VHSIRLLKTLEKGVSEGFQGQMREDDDVKEAKVIFINQTGTRYSLKPLYTNASVHMSMSVVKRKNYAHLS
jgi:hypothetical protein